MAENAMEVAEEFDVSADDLRAMLHNAAVAIAEDELARARIYERNPVNDMHPVVERIDVSGSELHQAFDALRDAAENTTRAVHDMSVDIFADSGDDRRHEPFARIPDAAEFLREYRMRFHGGYDDGMTLDEFAQVADAVRAGRLIRKEPDTTKLDEEMNQAFEEVFNG